MEISLVILLVYAYIVRNENIRVSIQFHIKTLEMKTLALVSYENIRGVLELKNLKFLALKLNIHALPIGELNEELRNCR